MKNPHCSKLLFRSSKPEFKGTQTNYIAEEQTSLFVSRKGLRSESVDIFVCTKQRRTIFYNMQLSFHLYEHICIQCYYLNTLQGGKSKVVAEKKWTVTAKSFRAGRVFSFFEKHEIRRQFTRSTMHTNCDVQFHFKQ